MTIRLDYVLTEGGMTITRAVGTDRRIEIPPSIGGFPVTSLGPRFLAQCPGGSGRTLVIPASVTSAAPDALEGCSGISRLEYGGDLAAFCSMGLTMAGDCEVVCTWDGDEYRFMFMGNVPMSFPEFDDAVLSLHMRLTMDTALGRLREPFNLTDENRRRYMRFVSDRVMPGAEQAVSDGDCKRLEELVSTDMISDGDLRRLLERSLRSGRVSVTSMLMTEIRRRASER